MRHLKWIAIPVLAREILWEGVDYRERVVPVWNPGNKRLGICQYDPPPLELSR